MCTEMFGFDPGRFDNLPTTMNELSKSILNND